MRLVPIEDSFEASIERYRPETRPNSTQSDTIHSQSDTGCVERKLPIVFATLTADEARAAAAAEELKLMPDYSLHKCRRRAMRRASRACARTNPLKSSKTAANTRGSSCSAARTPDMHVRGATSSTTYLSSQWAIGGSARILIFALVTTRGDSTKTAQSSTRG